ncbi:RING finger membrane protein [Diplocarpon rosae]|nr:RING finger membrane protein [Diplocarpon rosae]
MADLASPPDVMNDPQFATNLGDSEDGTSDADTCRICRSEGTDTEPLFHPCKCSGSIKYVHQDCLMEWLSHSQKKHCELCKTAFRFTKLYSPNMPKSLPFPVLIRHVFIHSLRNIATWIRFCLVITVWLGCLPYTIRQVWRLLFWLSDGNWPPNYQANPAVSNTLSIQALEMARELQKLASLAGNGTSPVTPLQDNQTSSASLGSLAEKFLGLLMPMSQMLNNSAADPLAAGILKSLYFGFGSQGISTSGGAHANTSIAQYSANQSLVVPTPSLLSDVRFLRNLTKHPYINQLVISTAEGYVITVLVVICFILVFLIREWVVQQQPGINMGAGFNAEFALPERGGDQQPIHELGPGIGIDENDVNAIVQDRMHEIPRRPMAQARRRNDPLDDVAEQPHNAANEMENLGILAEASASQNRPAPVRDALTPAAEIQRVITEEPEMTEEFLAIWRRADNSPGEVLRIIERENKGDQMRHWVNAMKLLTNPDNQESGLRASLVPVLPPTTTTGTMASTEQDLPTPNHPVIEGENSKQNEVQGNGRSRANSECWEDIESLDSHGHEYTALTETHGLDKGKGKAINEEITEPELNKAFQEKIEKGTSPRLKARFRPISGLENNNGTPEYGPPRTNSGYSTKSNSSRPRAASDGPRLRDTISPLANGSWTFSNLPTIEGSTSDATPAFDWSRERRTSDKGELLASSDHAAAGPSNAVSGAPVQGTQAWKTAQDLRVQHAIEKAREAHKNSAQHLTQASVSATQQNTSEHEWPLQIVGLDGVTRFAENWDQVFDANPVEEDWDSELDFANAGANVFQPDIPFIEPRRPIIVHHVQPRGLFANAAEFFWGGVGDDRAQEDLGANNEHLVHDLAAEAPFVPVAHHNAFEQDDEFGEPDPDVVEAAIAAGLDPNDPDAIDDAEDFEGIMELVGMRGPIISLVQNALFSALLVSLTVAAGIWIPYNIGRVSLLVAANPGPAFKLPLRYIFGFAALMQDLALSLIGLLSYVTFCVSSMPFKLLSHATSKSIVANGLGLGSTALKVSQDAAYRILSGTTVSLTDMLESDIVPFSAASHESLISLRAFVLDTLASAGSTLLYICTGDYKVTFNGTLKTLEHAAKHIWYWMAVFPEALSRPDTWVISLDIRKRATPLDIDLSVWDGTDRFWAIFAGYTALCLLGVLYVKKGSPFSSGQIGREWEATIIDLLNQAGGVMKVILIISIEMLVFPLYCGLLLDAALLPLFEDTTILSRILFTYQSPLTSIFVHWFVGTCYMFHFALFVSMCRKIMRKGVLYFIRDPDDPTFHPVRDVLERNVATQLRKILFSALVYGGLVVICLGGVVWGLAYAFKGVLPIHWSSNEPVLEFPIDLLFYNFLMPLAVKFFKPSDGLHAMYSWWFRRCARMLRLTWFMFDERRQDEEGYRVRKTWADFLRGANTESLEKIRSDDVGHPFTENPELTAYFRLNGRYVRAPASDQVRIPRGASTFLEVDEANHRLDGKKDLPNGTHSSGSDLYKQVYIPPWFRTRIFLFVVAIWLFAALTGVSITIVPLVFGRQVFAKIIPAHVRKNDVYAFSIGIYILGSAFYAMLHAGRFISSIRHSLALDVDTPYNVLRRVAAIASRVGRVAWTFTAFLFVLPTLFSFVIEFYLIVPLHTYFAIEEPHIMHLVQSWTLGLLYVKLTTRLILWYEDSRPAQSLRAITRNGYFDPDARLATRSFILPVTLALSSALWYPWCFAKFATLTVLKDTPEIHLVAYRYAYPMCLCLCAVGYALYILLGWMKDWRMKIRDEVYLIGERLHNFGDRKYGSGNMSVPNVRRIET